jgi:WD40 repeat protein
MQDDEPRVGVPTAQGSDAEQSGTQQRTAPSDGVYEEYIVSGEIGRGGLGRVLRAHDRRLGRAVALKEILRPDATPEHVARFLREARLAARLQHPAIVPVYELGTREDGAPFYTMKLVAGEPLDEVIARTRALGERLALLPTILAVADAIAYAHDRQIIHRDLKPANVIVGPFGETVVVDWGIAKDLSTAEARQPAADDAGEEEEASIALEETLLDVDSGAPRTRVGRTVGTLGYMPPEQLHGERVDERADVFALGACIYHALTGARPYEEASGAELRGRVAEAAPIPIERREPSIPPELAAIVKKAMARGPEERYRTAKELAADLRRFEAGQLVGAHHYTRAALLRRWLVRHRRAVLAVVGLVAVAATFATIAARRVLDERARAEERANALTMVEARASLARDPTATIGWLETYPLGGAERAQVVPLALDAQSRGVARHVLRGHNGDVAQLAVSPDMRHAATAGDQRNVRIWDVVAGRLERTFERTATTQRLAFSRDGAWLGVTAADGALALVEVATGETRVMASLHAHGASGLAPVAEGFATCGEDGAVRVVALPSGATRTLATFERPCDDLAASSDGRQLAVIDAEKAHVIDVASGQTRALALAYGQIHARVAWSPEGARLALVEAKPALAVWDLRTGAVTALTGHEGRITRAVFTSDGARLVTSGADKTVRVWDLATGSSRALLGHDRVVEHVDVAPGGRFALSCSEDTTARLWDLETGDASVLRGHTAHAKACRFTHDGRTAITTSADGTVRIWDVEATRSRVLAGHEDDVRTVAYAPEGTRAASGGQDNRVRVWDLATGKSFVLAGHESAVTRVRFLGADRLVSAGEDGTARLWDLGASPPRALEVVRHDGAINYLAVDDAAFYTAAADGTARVVSRDGVVIRTIRAHEGQARYVASSPDGASIATCGDDRVARLWNVRSGERLHELAGHTDTVSAVAWSPDGTKIATSSWDSTVRVWDARSGAATATLRGHRGRLWRVAFSPDSAHLASSGNDGELRLWTPATGEGVALVGHEGNVRTLAFSPDGAWLASGGNDGTIRIWRVSDGALAAVRRAESAVVSVAWSPDGRTLLSGGWDRMVRLWPLATPALPAGEETTRAWLGSFTSATIGDGGRLATP